MDVLIIYTSRKGFIRAEHRYAEEESLPEIKAELNSQGRIYDWWLPQDWQAFLDASKAHGIESQARSAMESASANRSASRPTGINAQQIPVTATVQVARDHLDEDECNALVCTFPGGDVLQAVEVDPDCHDLAKVLSAFLNRSDLVAGLVARLNARPDLTFDRDDRPRHQSTTDTQFPVRLAQIPIYVTESLGDWTEPDHWINLECRFPDGAKYGAIKVDPRYDDLAVLIYSFLNSSDLASQVIADLRAGEAINWPRNVTT